jgi:hypothetical protein
LDNCILVSFFHCFFGGGRGRESLLKGKDQYD